MKSWTYSTLFLGCCFEVSFAQHWWHWRAFYREAESYVSQHPIRKHQCTRLYSVPNLNSQASNHI